MTSLVVLGANGDADLPGMDVGGVVPLVCVQHDWKGHLLYQIILGKQSIYTQPHSIENEGGILWCFYLHRYGQFNL